MHVDSGIEKPEDLRGKRVGTPGYGFSANTWIRGFLLDEYGVGADEMRLPSIFGVFGSRVVNPSAELDEDTLTAIAEATGGRYFRAQNTAKLVEIYEIIDAMEPIEQDAETYRPTAALYHWPLAGGWLIIMFLLLCDWRGWGSD